MKELAPLLEKLAQQLGTTVTHLWTVLIAQEKIEFVFYLIEYVICFSLFGIWLWVFLKTFKPCQYEHIDYDNKPKTISCINRWILWSDKYNEAAFGIASIYAVPGIILIMWSILCISSMALAASSLLNPEYWALQKVLSIIK